MTPRRPAFVSSRRGFLAQSCAAGAAVAAAPWSTAAADPPPTAGDWAVDTPAYLLGRPLALPSGTHLVADRELIEDHWNIEWRVGRPALLPEPLFVPRSPWEDIQQGAKILRDPVTGRWRMWYQAINAASYRHGFSGQADPGPLPGAYCVALAESDDGLQWRVPEFDVWRTPDGRGTNVVFWGRHGGQMGDVLENVPGGSGRFAMAFLDEAGGAEGICLAWSGDGIHWRRDAANPVLRCAGDCQNNIVSSPSLGRYVLVTRPHPHNSGIFEWDPPGHRHMRRRVAVSTSPNLRDWTPIRTVLVPEPGDPPDFDHMTVMRYGTTCVGFLATFDGDAGVEQRMSVELAFSRDGLHWQRQRQASFLAPGFSGRGFDDRSVMVCGTWLPLDERRILLVAAGRGRPEKPDDPLSAVGRLVGMTLRRDGFVSATPAHGPATTVVRGDGGRGEARPAAGGPANGYLLTREVVLPAGSLTVNADATRGAVTVELVDRASTKPIPGFDRSRCRPIHGDEVAAAVCWEGSDLAALAGKPLMLRFLLEPGAQLYSFTV